MAITSVVVVWARWGCSERELFAKWDPGCDWI